MKKKLNLIFLSLLFVFVAFAAILMVSEKRVKAACSFGQSELTITTSVSPAEGGTSTTQATVCKGWLSGSVSVELKMTLNEGYKFLGWYNSSNSLVSSTATGGKVSVSGSSTFVAKVERLNRINFTSIENATASASYTWADVNEQINVKNFYNVAEGYAVGGYIVDGVTVTDSTIYTAEAKDVSISPTLVSGIKVTFTSDANITVKYSEVSFLQGEVINLNDYFTAKSSYKIDHFLIDGVRASSDTFEVGSSKVTIKAISRFYAYLLGDSSKVYYETFEEAFNSSDSKFYLRGNMTITNDVVIPNGKTFLIPYAIGGTGDTVK